MTSSIDGMSSMMSAVRQTGQQNSQRAASRSSHTVDLVINQRMRVEASAATEGARNGERGVARQQTASQALDHAGEMVNRLQSLATRAADGTMNAGDRAVLQEEAANLQEALGDLVANTKFNGQQILQGDQHQTHVDATISATDADGNAVTSKLAGIDLSTQAGANAALGQIKDAQEALTQERVIASNGASRLDGAARLSNAKALELRSAASAGSEMDVIKVVEELAKMSVEQVVKASVQASIHKTESQAIDKFF